MGHDKNKFSPNDKPRHSSRIKKRLRTMTDKFVPLEGKKSEHATLLHNEGMSPRYSGENKGFFL
jgi:hypothetical protein